MHHPSTFSSAAGFGSALRPSRRGTVAAAALALLFSGVAGAQDSAPAPDVGGSSQHEAEALFAALAEQEAARAGDSDFDYEFGVAALDAGHLTRAIFALERVVDVRPNDARARAELGRAYLAAGDIGLGQAELRAARRADLPEAAAAAIDRVLGAIDRVVAVPGGPKTTGYLEVGGGWDSNVNSASNLGAFAVPAFGGLLFTVDPDSRSRHDAFATTAGGVATRVDLDPAWAVVAALNGRANVNRRAHEMNTAFVDASVGVAHAAGTQQQTVALQTNTAWVGSRPYRAANGVSAQWQTQFGPATQASAFGQWSRQEYAGQPERNTDRTVLGIGSAHRISGFNTLAYGSAYVADEHARHDEHAWWGHRAAGLRAGLEYKAGDRATGFAEWQWERRHYGGVEPLFGQGRHDHQSDLLAGLRFAPAAGWQLLPQIRRTVADSNLAIYQYRRTVVQLVLRKDFS